MEFEITPKENKPNYSYLSGIKDDTPREPSTVNVVFSHQSVIVIFICAIMLLIASFSLGVEKGKLMAKDAASVEKASPAVAPVAQVASVEKTQPGVEKTQNALPSLALANPSGNVAQRSQNENPVVVTPQALTTPEAQASVKAPLPTGGYTIQVASVNTESSAKGLAETLSKRGFSAFTKKTGKYFVVLVGNFAKKEEAQNKLRELKKTYTDSYIKKI